MNQCDAMIQVGPHITAIQFRRAQLLARAYGHEWGQVLVTLGEEADPLAGAYQDQQAIALALPAPMAAVQDAIDAALDPQRSMPGLGFSISHVTGSGRLQWEVHESGAVDLWVRRPGATLVALRAMEAAMREAHPGATAEFQTALQALAGASIAYGSMSGESPLGQEMSRHEGGVVVLYASVAPNGAVEIEEKTRWSVSSDHDAAELRHWIALREALQALGAALPQPRPEVDEALRRFDEEAAEMAAQRKWFDALPWEDQERLRSTLASNEADLAAAMAASILPAAPVEVARRRPATMGAR